MLSVFAVLLMVGATPARADDDHDRGHHYGWSHNRQCDDDRSDYQWNWGWHPSRNYDYYPRDWYRDRNYGGRDNRWQYGQFEKIREGIRDGRLSQAEVRELSAKEEALRNEIRNDRADGRFTSDEREDIRNSYQHLNKDINHELNDGERRF